MPFVEEHEATVGILVGHCGKIGSHALRSTPEPRVGTGRGRGNGSWILFQIFIRRAEGLMRTLVNRQLIGKASKADRARIGAPAAIYDVDGLVSAGRDCLGGDFNRHRPVRAGLGGAASGDPSRIAIVQACVHEPYVAARER